jgi:curli production assembly/transport component CsgF
MYVIMGIVMGVGLLVPVGAATATELVWVPINPSFGGYAGNASWLMASAQAQNKFVKKADPYKPPASDPVKDFETRLNSQLLYQLASKIVSEAFGEDSLLPADQPEAHYSVGNFKVDISTDLTKIMITLTDTATGAATTVEVPYY